MLRRADFDNFINWYTVRHQRKYGQTPSGNTLRTKRGYLATAGNAVGAREERELATLLSDRQAVENLLDVLSARISPAALAQVFYALKPLGDYALAQGWITHSELQKDDKPTHIPQKPITVYTPEEMELFVSASRGVTLRWWAFMSFLAETGRRVGELLALEWAWYAPTGVPPYFALPRSKNGDQQYIPLTRRLREDVFTEENVQTLRAERVGRKARDPEFFVFPWQYTTVHKMFERFCNRTGLPNRGFHAFRHTVITQRIAAGVPIQAVSTLAGHRSTQVTMGRYNHATALDYVRYLDE